MARLRPCGAFPIPGDEVFIGCKKGPREAGLSGDFRCSFGVARV